jgi:hypothetical protein
MSVQAVGANKSAVTGAIRTAAQATGVNFNYLLATAKVESDLDPNLTMRTSTATGLFQFLEQTWLGTLKQAGPALGYGSYASAISKSSSGRYEVADPALRREIMQLRKDPTANALMGGAFTQQNMAVLSQRIGRKPSEGELYIGHFFGPYAGAKAINLAASNPTANAAGIFPEAAAANRSIFYDRQGNARSVAGVYSELNRRYQVARANVVPGGAPTAVAANTAAPSSVPNAAAPDTAGTASAFAVAAARPVVAAAEPAFHSLFHTDEARGAVSPIVTGLWGASANPAAGAGDVPTVTAQAVSAPSAQPPLDLFQDMRPDVRGLFRGNGRV